jgi:hypothetical protein
VKVKGDDLLKPTNRKLFHLITDKGFFKKKGIHKDYNSLIDELFYMLYGSNNNNNNYVILLLQISSQFGFIGILSYIIRNIVQIIPYPLNGYYNYDRSQLYELLRGTLIATFLFLFSPNLQVKITNLRNYFSKKLNNIKIFKNSFMKNSQEHEQREHQEQQGQQDNLI